MTRYAESPGCQRVQVGRAAMEVEHLLALTAMEVMMVTVVSTFISRCFTW